MIYSSESQIIRGCVKGKSSAQKRLYDLYSKEMFKVCLVYAYNYDLANDLLQEGFLKVFQNIHKYENTGPLGGWIRRIIVNTCIDYYRGDKWHRYRESLTIENNPRQFEQDDYNIFSIYEREDFLRITSSLPDGYRVVMNLFFLEDMTHKEIAQKLDITEGTSKSQLAKAKKYLKDILVNELTQEEISQYERSNRKVV